MSIKIPELSFIDTFSNIVTSEVNCEGYSALSYYIILENTGTLSIQTSVDGINFYTHELINITSTGAIYQGKLNITFKYLRYDITQSLSGSCQLQSFFFESGDVRITEFINSTGILTCNATGPINSSAPNGPITNISISQATASVDGFLAYTDFQTFNNKVSSVSGSAPISVTPGLNPTISLDDTAVVPGSYNLVSATVDQKGRLTSIGNGTAVTSLTAGTGISVSASSGAVTISNTASSSTSKMILFSPGTVSVIPSSVKYMAFGSNASGITIANYQTVLPIGGTLKNLYVHYNTSNSARVDWTIMVNNVSTAITCRILSGSTSGNDTTNTATVNAGDRVCIKFDEGLGPGSAGYFAVSCELEV